jgi:fructose-1,6-bisphosphatase-3
MSSPLKNIFLEKYKNKEVLSLINRRMLIHKQLQQPARTYVVYSDLHGSYEKFLHWLKNGLGYYKIAVKDFLGNAHSEEILQIYECLLYLVNKAKIDDLEKFIEGNKKTFHSDEFFPRPISKKFLSYLGKLEEKGISKKRIIEDIFVLLRGITRGDERRIVKTVPEEHLENILKLYVAHSPQSDEAMLDGIVAQEEIFQIFTSLLIKVTCANMFDKHINLGDTYDRGEAADKLVSIYRHYFNESSPYSPPLHYIWGNHDIVWLGAAVGNPILAMTALRISMRYNNVSFLDRYGFNLDKLKSYAEKCYQLTPRGNYTKGSDSSIATKMTKVLFVLESKLTVSCLKEMQEVNYTDVKRDLSHHEALLKLLPTGVKEDEKKWDEYKERYPLFDDSFFPTIDPENPDTLTLEEQEIVDDLVSQFKSLSKLQDDMKWMLRVGETYRVVDKTLYFHAAIPATEDKNLEEVNGLKGKELLDFIHLKLKTIGSRHNAGNELPLEDKMYFWFLWCGPESAFFCKSKMATVERTVFDKAVAAKDNLTTHSERPNSFYKNIRDDKFLNRVLKEFAADKICMGHTPVKTLKQTILSENVGAFCVDGGASDAYGDRGAVLISTPEFNYLTFQPSLKDIKIADSKNQIPEIEVIPLEEKKNFKLGDMDKGHHLKVELEAIEELLKASLSTFKGEYFL